MNISPLSSINNNLNFKSNITFDIGGSQREGSLKVFYSTTETDEEIYKEHTTVNKLGKTKFKNGDDFIKQLVNKIANVQQQNKKAIARQGYSKAENTIKNIAIFLPSYTSGLHAYYLPNHRNSDGEPLNDIEFADLKERLIKAKVDVAPNVKIKILQDAMGVGLAIAKKLNDNNLLHDGSYYTVCITGGGCGIANIEKYDDNNIIIKSSGSGCLSQALQLEKVSRVGASAPALIENFCQSLGMHETEVRKIKACHKAEFTMNNPCTYEKDKKTAQLREVLLSTGKFEIEKENEKTFTIKIKDKYSTRYDEARRNAISKYCLALARLAVIKRNDGSNGMVITGPVAKSVDTAIKDHYNSSLSEWINGCLRAHFNTDEIDKMQKTYKFQVICNDTYSLADNTTCKKLVHNAEFISKTRGNWVKISTRDLED